MAYAITGTIDGDLVTPDKSGKPIPLGSGRPADDRRKLRVVVPGLGKDGGDLVLVIPKNMELSADFALEIGAAEVVI